MAQNTRKLRIKEDDARSRCATQNRNTSECGRQTDHFWSKCRSLKRRKFSPATQRYAPTGNRQFDRRVSGDAQARNWWRAQMFAAQAGHSIYRFDSNYEGRVLVFVFP